jgi:PiT family inorganic phosphate transporter
VRLALVRWGVAGNMLVAWALTFPAAACTAGLVYGFMSPDRARPGR